MLVSRTAINSVSTHVGYDDNGNMNKAPVPSDMANHHYVCTYDFRNRLVKVETDGQTPKKVAEYFYDGLNRRIRKITYDANEDEVCDTRYLYDGWRCIEERDVNDSSELRARYVYGGLYVDEPVRMYRDTNDNGDFTDEGDTNVYYLQDRLFNVAALTDTDGAIVERTWYEPYGQPTNRRESDDDETTASHFGNPMLFCGYRYDDETELYHVRNRYQHPTLGRWISRDPIGYGDGTNLYEYVGSGPTNETDPEGLAAVEGTYNRIQVVHMKGLEDRKLGYDLRIKFAARISKVKGAYYGAQVLSRTLSGMTNRGTWYSETRWVLDTWDKPIKRGLNTFIDNHWYSPQNLKRFRAMKFCFFFDVIRAQHSVLPPFPGKFARRPWAWPIKRATAVVFAGMMKGPKKRYTSAYLYFNCHNCRPDLWRRLRLPPPKGELWCMFTDNLLGWTCRGSVNVRLRNILRRMLKHAP